MDKEDIKNAKREVKSANKLWNNAFATVSSSEKMIKEINKVGSSYSDRETKGIIKNCATYAYKIGRYQDLMNTAFSGYINEFGIQTSKINRMDYPEFRDSMNMFVENYDKLRSTYDKMFKEYNYLADYRKVKYINYVERERY